MNTDLKDLALTIMCGRCEARPGEPCRSVGGHKAPTPHTVRVDAIYAAYAAGYEDGRQTEKPAT